MAFPSCSDTEINQISASLPNAIGRRDARLQGRSRNGTVRIPFGPLFPHNAEKQVLLELSAAKFVCGGISGCIAMEAEFLVFRHCFGVELLTEYCCQFGGEMFAVTQLSIKFKRANRLGNWMFKQN